MSVIIAQNQTGGALTLNELPIPNNQIPASSNVTLTDYATISEIQNDDELLALIVAGSVLLNVAGITLTQAESQAAASPVIQSPTVYADYYDAGTTSVGTTALTLGLDTARQANAAFVLAADEITVQATGAGTYLLRYDVTTNETSTGGQGLDIWLENNASEVAASRIKTEHYTSNTNNTAGRTMVLTVAASDVLRLRAQLTAGAGTITTLVGGVTFTICAIGSQGNPGPQGPTGAGSSVNVESSGSSIGSPFDTINFIGLSASDAGSGTADIEFVATGAFANYYNNAAYTGITTSVSTLPFPDTRISNAAFTIDGSGEQVTINTAGTYRVDFGCSPDESSGNDITTDMWLELDRGAGFAEVPGTRARFFHDNNTEEGGNSGFAIIAMEVTDIFRIRAQVVGGSDQLDTLANSLRLSIQSVGANGAAGATGPQGPQGPTGSGSDIIVEDEGSNIPNTPHSNLNFVGAGVTATDGGSGVATITIPGGSAGANIAQYRRTWDLTINTSATTIAFNATDFEDSNYTIAALTGLITINTSGVYKISYSVYFDTNVSARRTVDAWVENNSVEIVPSRAASYARNATDDTSSTGATFMADLTATDVIRLRAQSTGTNGTALGKGNRMWICLEFMRA